MSFWSVCRSPLGAFPTHCRCLWRGYPPIILNFSLTAPHSSSQCLYEEVTVLDRLTWNSTLSSLTMYGLTEHLLGLRHFALNALFVSCYCPLVPFGPK